MTDSATVVLLGGTGFFGNYLVDDLLERTSARVVVASRHRRGGGQAPKVEHRACDVFDESSIRKAIGGADIVVHCAGPFEDLPLAPVDAAIAERVHYIDISEDRLFARLVSERDDEARNAGVSILNGCSVVPAMSIAVAKCLTPPEGITGVRTFAAPDTFRNRGPAMFLTMLRGAGRSFAIPRNGTLRAVRGWSEPEWIDFPPPVGRRLMHLVLEMSDIDEIPKLTGAGTVEFKAGCEFAILNRMMAAVSIVAERAGTKYVERLLPVARTLAWSMGWVGQDVGAAMFELTSAGSVREEKTLVAVVADHDGGRIPIVLAGMAVEDLLAGRLSDRGVIPPGTWLSRERLLSGLADRELQVVTKSVRSR
jgi:short subunit dehydrogenase-like uncharacterized protein